MVAWGSAFEKKNTRSQKVTQDRVLWAMAVVILISVAAVQQTRSIP